MFKSTDLHISEINSIGEIQEQLDVVSQALFEEIKTGLDLEPVNVNIKFVVVKESSPKETSIQDIFKIGF
ncbi:MAG: hypothetical protein KJI71_04090 [Patescibacteria group bacterium]|nr:hypothetical protein [Patescibacteria group bacterium]